MKRLLPLLVLIACMPHRGFADTTTIGTAITSVPYTISTSGAYYLNGNLAYTPTSGVAIRIQAIDTVLDLNGFELVTGGSANTSYAISCNHFDRVTVKNGTIRGFQTGVNLLSNACTVTGLLVAGNFQTGINAVGDNVQVSSNHVCTTGGSTAAGVTYSVGISVTGSSGTVTDNDVQSTFITDKASHYADGILITGGSNIVVSNNRVLGVAPLVPEFALSNGIAVNSSANLVILGNTVISAHTGFYLPGASGKYGDNTTTDVSTTYETTGSGMINIGNNN